MTPVELLFDIYTCETRASVAQVQAMSRAVATVGRVVISIFRQCDGYTTHFYAFWNADSESDIDNFEFEKKLTARAT